MASAAALSAARRHCGAVALSETARSASGSAAASRTRADTASMLATTCAATACVVEQPTRRRASAAGRGDRRRSGTFSRKNRSRGFEPRSVSSSCTSVAASIDAGRPPSTVSICSICCAATATRVGWAEVRPAAGGGGGAGGSGGTGDAVDTSEAQVEQLLDGPRRVHRLLQQRLQLPVDQRGHLRRSGRRPARPRTRCLRGPATARLTARRRSRRESNAGPRSAPRLPISVPISGVLPSRSGPASAMACCSARNLAGDLLIEPSGVHAHGETFHHGRHVTLRTTP